MRRELVVGGSGGRSETRHTHARSCIWTMALYGLLCTAVLYVCRYNSTIMEVQSIDSQQSNAVYAVHTIHIPYNPNLRIWVYGAVYGMHTDD